MPGKIIQSMRKAKTANPLFLLDEVDKMGSVSAAIVLGPAGVLDRAEPPSTINYLEVDSILSNVMFITTANTLNPAAADGPHGDHPHRRLHGR